MKIVAVLYPGGEHAEDERLLGCAEQALGLREALGDEHEVVGTSDLDGDALDAELADAEVLITTPFWPLQVTSEVFEKAPKLKLAVTAGVGSDHIDLAEAAKREVEVVEITASNDVSVAEHAVMSLLVLLRNFVRAHDEVRSGGWDIADVAIGSRDLERKTIGIYGAGRIGQLIALRLQPFDVDVIYFKRSRLTATDESELGMRFGYLEEMQQVCDAIVIAAPLTPETEGLFDAEVIGGMRQGSRIVNIARGAICDRDAVVQALQSGQLAGYAGDVWDPQPAQADHPWRTMPNHAMTPHVSGTNLESQIRYASGVRNVLQKWIAGDELRSEDVIVSGGEVVGGAYAAAFADD